MDEFIKKWKSDKKYQAKIKLILYGIFIILVVLYASTLNTNINKDNKKDEPKEIDTLVIAIPKEYHYNITIDLDNNSYKYYGDKTSEKTTITKETDVTKNYIYQNNEYYIEDNGTYVKTTKDEIYDIINYNYLNIDSINNYLKNATKNGNEYLVYLKDIILDDDSNEYITIEVNDNNISIDYTELMRKINNNERCNVDIQIESNE